jgi:hypothetical protein
MKVTKKCPGPNKVHKQIVGNRQHLLEKTMVVRCPTFTKALDLHGQVSQCTMIPKGKWRVIYISLSFTEWTPSPQSMLERQLTVQTLCMSKH